MIIEIPNENSIVKWKNDEKDEWKIAEISDLIKAYERPQGKWFDFIDKGTLKARHGDYILFKVDYLLDHLAREVYIMECARKMRGIKNENQR